MKESHQIAKAPALQKKNASEIDDFENEFAGKSMSPPAFRLEASAATSNVENEDEGLEQLIEPDIEKKTDASAKDEKGHARRQKKRQNRRSLRGLELNWENLQKVLAMFPKGRTALSIFKEYGYAIEFGAGKGSFCNYTKVTIQGDLSLEDAASVFVHEMHHAISAYTTRPAPMDLPLTEFLDAYLMEDVNAEIEAFEAILEMKEHGIKTKEAIVNSTTYDDYLNAFRAAKKKARKAGKSKIDADSYAKDEARKVLLENYKHSPIKISQDERTFTMSYRSSVDETGYMNNAYDLWTSAQDVHRIYLEGLKKQQAASSQPVTQPSNAPRIPESPSSAPSPDQKPRQERLLPPAL